MKKQAGTVVPNCSVCHLSKKRKQPTEGRFYTVCLITRTWQKNLSKAGEFSNNETTSTDAQLSSNEHDKYYSEYTVKKGERKLSSYLRKFRRIWGNIWGNSEEYEEKYEEMRKYLVLYEGAVIVIYDFAPDPFWISLDMRSNFLFFLNSVPYLQRWSLRCSGRASWTCRCLRPPPPSCTPT